MEDNGIIEEVIDEDFFTDKTGDDEKKESEVNFGGMFSFRQIGSVAKYVEPINGSTSIETLAQMFKDDPSLTAVPIEEYDRVIGVLDRNTVVENTSTAFKRFMGKDAASYVKRNLNILYAGDFIEKKLAAISEISRKEGIIYFPVFNNRSFFGIVSLDDFLERISDMREQDMEKARVVQQNLLPKSDALKNAPFELTIWNKMANQVGGDFYAAEQLSDTLYVGACFDVSGKNFSAALLTVAIGAFFAGLKHKLIKAEGCRRLTSVLDAYLKEIVPVGSFVTCTLCFVDTSNKSVIIQNCAHTPVYVFAPKDTGGIKKTLLASVAPTLPPLGLGDVKAILDAQEKDGVPQKKTSVAFAYTKGMHINIYSDGITDMQNIDGIRYDEQRTKRFFTDLYKKDIGELNSFAEKTVNDWLQEAMQNDDITILDIRF